MAAKRFPALREYLAPRCHSLWQWSDGAEAIAWTDGETIVFRDELEMILRELASGGVPPLNALLLLLAACRDSWQESSQRLGAFVGMISTLERCDVPPWLPDVFVQLDAINLLPAELRTTSRGKAILAEIVFDTSREADSPVLAREILETLHNGPEPEILAPQGTESRVVEDLLRHLNSLHEGLQKIDRNSLQMRLRTGLEEIVAPADVEMDPVQRIRHVLGQLQNDQQLGGLVRLAKHLMAIVSLPWRLALHEALPLGGVCDITNRGPLDRLLLSELAYDDTTLASRVAMNEALYLRRESPPKYPPRNRAVLIDAGIRLWGVPRVFATGVALALAATSDRKAETLAFRARGDRIEPIDLVSRQGLIRHMEALEPQAHPGDALPAFLDAIGCRSDPADVVLVTGDDVLEDREFQRALALHDLAAVYVATVNRSGDFCLQLRTGRGLKILRKAKLDLDTLLTPRARPSTPLINERQAALPAIFSVRPLPLLLPCRSKIENAWTAGAHGVVSLANDGRLMWWRQKQRGAAQLAENMPPGQVLWCLPRAVGGTTSAVIGRLQQAELHLLHVDFSTAESELTRLEVDDEPIRAVTVIGPVVIAIYAERVSVIETADGRQVRTIASPSRMVHHRDRFFRRGRRWYTLAYDGLGVQFEEVPVGNRDREVSLQAMFTRVASPGPVGLTTEGDLYLTAEGQVNKIPHWVRGPFQVMAIARDGERVVIVQRPRTARERCLVNVVDVGSGNSHRARPSENPLVLAEPDLAPAIDQRTLRHRFVGIEVDSQGRLTLISRKGHPVCLEVRQGDIVLRSPGGYDSTRPPTAAEPSRTNRLAFRPVDAPTGARYTLGVATWPDGSEAFLDSRGLLHLRSSDPDVLQTTLVLYEGATAGWCSDGRVWGPPYFTDATAAGPAGAIFDVAIQPFLDRLL